MKTSEKMPLLEFNYPPDTALSVVQLLLENAKARKVDQMEIAVLEDVVTLVKFALNNIKPLKNQPTNSAN